MKDAEWRGLILQRLYDIRHLNDGATMITDGLGLYNQVPSGFDNLIVNVADQLKQQSLIVFNELVGARRMGRAKITAFGVDVIEGTKQAAIAITVDQSTNIHNSRNVQLGKGNIQNVDHIGALTSAIEQSQATTEEKEAARSLLQKVVDNPLLKMILEKLGAGVFG
jgi:hypothetical protein